MPKKEDTLNSMTVQSSGADDLKLINGIGPAVEKRLYDFGIFTFAQLAVLSPADIAAAVADLNGLSAERISKQDWTGQARKLVAGSVGNELQHIESEIVANPSVEEYQLATFMIKLLLDEHNNVQSTYAQHIQTEHEQTWTGWRKTQLLDFLGESAGINNSSDEHDLIPANTTVSEPDFPLTMNTRLSGTLRVPEIEMIGVTSAGHYRTIVRNEPFSVRLTLDLSDILVPSNTSLQYKTSLYGKGRGRHGLMIMEAQGTIIRRDSVAIMVEGNTLPKEGIYQITATVILGLPNMKLATRPGVIAIVDGGLLEVY